MRAVQLERQPGHLQNFTGLSVPQFEALVTALAAEVGFNPIENLFAKIKAYVRKPRPDTVHNLIKAFKDAVSSVTPTAAANAFKRCGYR